MRFAPGVRRFAVPTFAAAAVFAVVAPPLAVAALAVGAFVAWFFRDPDRRPSGPGVVSPADGRVSVLRREGDQLRIGVYLSATDIHVTRAPFDGRVVGVTHRPGAHRPAFSKASERNERVDIDIEAEAGPAEVSMIAGAVARRIHPYVDEGADLSRGQRLGHIDFGSRTDVLLPPAYDREDLIVEEGDRVRAGESIVASTERQ